MKKNHLIANIITGLMIFSALLIGSLYYLSTILGAVRVQSVEKVLDLTQQGGFALDIYLLNETQNVHWIADKLSEVDDERRLKLGSYIRFLAKEEKEKYYTIYDLTEGVYYTTDDTPHPIGDKDVEGYKDASEKGILTSYFNRYNGQKTFAYYERFTFADGHDGILEKCDTITDIANTFVMSFYDNSGFSYVIDKDGVILLRSSNPKSNRTFLNLFDVFSMDGNPDGTEIKFREEISSARAGAMDVTISGEESVLVYAPIEHTDGWYMISTVPDSVIMDQAYLLLRGSVLIFVIAVISIFIVAYIVILKRSSQKKIESQNTELHYRDQLFSMLVSGTNDIFLMLTKDGHVIEYVSPNVDGILGISDEKIRSDISILDDTLVSGPTFCQFNRIDSLDPGENICFENSRINKKTGDKKWFSEIVYRVSFDDADKFIIVISDRSFEHKSKEALADALEVANAANKSKSMFLSNMSHDIRTPLNAISGLSTLIMRDADRGDLVREHTQKIMSSSQHLLQLINDVLDMSKIESGKTTLNIEEFVITDMVSELETMIRSQAFAKEQLFTIKYFGIKNKTVYGDKFHIQQVLINILSNAVKYTQRNGRIAMTVKQMPIGLSQYARYCFTISDNGIGMTEDFVKNIFNAFSREDNSMSNNVQGTGLGMAIAKNLVDLLGGTIEVKSSKGRGSTFNVSLDMRIGDSDGSEDEKTAGHETDAEISHDGSLSGMNILAAEDNDLNGEILIELLKMEGAECRLAKNGKAAFELFEASRDNEYDLILMDVQMPVMDGYDATEAIRACSHANAQTIPIIAMTANAFAEDVQKAKNVGMNAHVSKPVNMETLQRTIGEVKRNGTYFTV